MLITNIPHATMKMAQPVCPSDTNHSAAGIQISLT